MRKVFASGISIIVLVLTFFVLSGTLPAVAQGGALDGKTFVGHMGEKGKKGDKDEFVFTSETFESKACEKYGFGTAPYTATASGKTTSFQAETTNDKGAKMKWTGKVTGDKIYGTSTLYEQGKAPVIYWFKGKLSA